MARVTPALFDLDDYSLIEGDSDGQRQLTAGTGWTALYERNMNTEDNQGTADIYGRGRSQNPLQAQGFLGLRFVNPSGAASREQAVGKVRIAKRTPSGEVVDVLYEDSLEAVDLFTGSAGSGTKKDRKDRQAFPQQNEAAVAKPYTLTIDLKVRNDINVADGAPETQAALEGRSVVRTN